MKAEYDKYSKPIKVRPNFYTYCFFNLKEIAITYGYNLVIHGSMDRDLDLIAIPWGNELGNWRDMVNEFAEFIGGTVMTQSPNQERCFPHNRISTVVNVNRGGKYNNYIDIQYYIDISIINPPELAQSELSTKISEIEKTFTDRKVRPLDPVWVKNEILKLLKGE